LPALLVLVVSQDAYRSPLRSGRPPHGGQVRVDLRGAVRAGKR
jgi:hypothetical protein